MLAALVVLGCGRERGARAPAASAVADSGGLLADRPRDGGLPAVPPDSIAPPPLTALRIALPVPESDVPPPEAAPAEPPAATDAVERLPVDDALRPPIPRTTPRRRVGPRARGWIELDVRVDERGEVTEAVFVNGTGDSASVRAAIVAARALRYYPARQAGKPVAVWCRQRFDGGR